MIEESEPARMTAAEASRLISARKLSCEELVRSCLTRIAARDSDVKAWLWLDAEHAIRRARELDKRERKSPLHGIPWGVKDVIDTADYPTTQNSPIYDGMRVGRDAAPVAVVRGAGAIILGKTDTVEFASSGRKAVTAIRTIRHIRLADRHRGRARPWAIFRSILPLAHRPADHTSGRHRSTASTALNRAGIGSAAREYGCRR